MSDLGSFAFRFHETANSLRDFDRALRYLRQSTGKKPERAREEVNHLLKVLDPITEALNGSISGRALFDEQYAVNELQHRSTKDWQNRRLEIIGLTKRLASGVHELTKSDLAILNDIADAVGTECAGLFHRISGRS